MPTIASSVPMDITTMELSAFLVHSFAPAAVLEYALLANTGTIQVELSASAAQVCFRIACTVRLELIVVPVLKDITQVEQIKDAYYAAKLRSDVAHVARLSTAVLA
jgi:hypothetical protein